MGRRLIRGAVGGAVAAAALVAAACTPAGGAWSGTDAMSTSRVGHEATLLTSNGRVLVTGGSNGSGPLRSVERWDPGTGDWTTLAPMSAARSGHTATELPDGRILAAGGSASATAEVYSRSADRWTPTGPMVAARSGHAAARLSDGTVLVAGPGTSAERYSSTTNAWTATGRVPVTADDPDGAGDEYQVLSPPRLDGLAALSSGRALAFFSWETAHLPDCPGAVCGSTYITTAAVEYASSADGWSRVEGPPESYAESAVTRLDDGRTLVTGGYSTGIHGIRSTSSAVQVYNAVRRVWSVHEPMNDARQDHAGTLLTDGRVLVSGGWSSSDSPPERLASAELYDGGVMTPTGSMAGPRWDHEAVGLRDGRALVVGGRNASGGPLASAEVYSPG